jgi:AraC-like DNA-binding protein
VLSRRNVVSGDGVRIMDVACRHPAGRGQAPEQADAHMIVFVRRGCFVRSADGVEALLDPTTAYCLSPGQELRYDHPHAGGDDCTALSLSPELVASIWGGDPALPAPALRVGPEADLEHRLLLAAARRGTDQRELTERAIGLVAGTLELADSKRVAAGRPATAHARRGIVDAVREALAEDPDRSLPELARVTAVSPHHLSRVFRSITGHTISRHRMRLRVRGALERLGGGERDLARLAADTGFVDQSHLCRVIRQETGSTPAELRAALALFHRGGRATDA